MQNRLKKLRKELGLNQTEFANRLGLTQSTITLLEHGKTPITDKHIKPICSVFNVNENWFKTGEGQMFAEDLVIELIDKTASRLNSSNQEYLLSIAKAMLDKQNECDPSDPSGF